MPKDSFVVSPQIPEPARNLLAVVRSRLKLSKADGMQLIQDGGVRVNGRFCMKSHQQLEPGDKMEIDWIKQPPRPAAGKKNQDSSTFRIVFEDEHLIVVHKPANLLTVPTLHRESKTLLSLVTTHVRQYESADQAYCVHRLDRGVSGLLVFAKSLEMAEKIRDQFAARKPDRKYIAICAGTWRKPNGTIQSYLATDENLNRYSTTDREAGELAITHYVVREEWKDASMLEIQLETGRRNQIRVHLAESNHPILGDPRYRSHQAEHWAWPHRRIALHAESLGFEHPKTGKPLQFTCSWPDEFRTFQRRMNKGSGS